MTQNLISLSDIHSSWKGHLIPSAFASLQLGIECENTRLREMSYIVMQFLHEYDYDGLTKYLQIVDGFIDSEAAIDFTNGEALTTLNSTVAEPCYGDYEWREIELKLGYRLLPKANCACIHSKYVKVFKIENGSGYDSRYYQYEVLYVNLSDVVGPDIFSCIKTENEWVHYLISCGESYSL